MGDYWTTGRIVVAAFLTLWFWGAFLNRFTTWGR